MPKSVTIPFSGMSMWPLLVDGERVVVDVGGAGDPLSSKDIGALFVFKDTTEWVCHRYLGIKNGGHVFKGDFSTVYEIYDEPKILGRVVGVEGSRGTRSIRTVRPLNLALCWLQSRAIGGGASGAKVFRYGALILAWSFKPLLYGKIQPSQIVE